MTNQNHNFDAKALEALPARVELDDTRFTAAFEARQSFLESVGGSLTFTALCDEADVHIKLLWKARNGKGALPPPQSTCIGQRPRMLAILHHQAASRGPIRCQLGT